MLKKRKKRKGENSIFFLSLRQHGEKVVISTQIKEREIVTKK